MNNQTPKQSHSFARSIIEYFETLVFAACAVIVIFSFFFRLCSVDGSSMNMTLQHGDKVLVSNIAYTPERGDIIVFHMTGEGKFNEPLVKRVIATGGEWIDIDFETWKVRIADNPEMENALTLEEHYIHIDGYTLRSDFTFPLQVPEGYLFVLGDNRNGSSDSRSAKCGLVDERRVLGKVLMRVYPFEKIED